MTVGFHQLEVGDTLEVKGPLGSFVWQGSGTALWKGVSRKVTELGLVGGGSGMSLSKYLRDVDWLKERYSTGITPILQVLRSVLHDHADTTTKLWLISANKTEFDILFREEIDRLCAQHSSRFHVHYVVSSHPPSDWPYDVGRVSEVMLRDHLPLPGKGGMILACGPQGMIDLALKPGLRECGWDIQRDLVTF